MHKWPPSAKQVWVSARVSAIVFQKRRVGFYVAKVGSVVAVLGIQTMSEAILSHFVILLVKNVPVRWASYDQPD